MMTPKERVIAQIHLEVPALKEPTFEGYEFPPTEAFFGEGWRGKAL